MYMGDFWSNQPDKVVFDCSERCCMTGLSFITEKIRSFTWHDHAGAARPKVRTEPWSSRITQGYDSTKSIRTIKLDLILLVGLKISNSVKHPFTYPSAPAWSWHQSFAWWDPTSSDTESKFSCPDLRTWSWRSCQSFGRGRAMWPLAPIDPSEEWMFQLWLCSRHRGTYKRRRR